MNCVFVGCFETDRVSSQTGRVLFMTDRVIQNTGRYYNIHYCLLENRPGLLPNRPVFTGTCFPRWGAFATKIHVMCVFFLYVIVPSLHILRSFFLHTPTILFKPPPLCFKPGGLYMLPGRLQISGNEHMLTTTTRPVLLQSCFPRVYPGRFEMYHDHTMQISKTHTLFLSYFLTNKWHRLQTTSQ